MKRMALKLPFEYCDTPDLRVLDLSSGGIERLPVLVLVDQHAARVAEQGSFEREGRKRMNEAESVLRYRSGGELHRDFHASILDGANYVRDNYGEDALREVLFETGTKVYKTLHEKLVAGDPSELLAWWRYYMDREGADYSLEETAGGAVLTVRDCPALRHLERRGIPGGKGLCAATRILNEAFCSGSPYEIVLEETGGRSCRQVLRRRRV